MSFATGAPPGSEFPLSDSAFALQSPDATRQQVIHILVREHYAGLLRFAKVILGELAQARGLARATIAVACERRAEFQGQVSSQAWLYAILWRLNKRTRSWYPQHIPALLPLLHHHEHLPLEEIAFILRTNPDQIAHQLNGQEPYSESDLLPLETLAPDEVNQISRAILEGNLIRPARGMALSPELGWLSLALFAVLFLFTGYLAGGNADDGQSLFPTATPTRIPIPTPTAVSGIPLLEFDAPFDSRPFESSEPRISADGRFVVFASTGTGFGLPFPDIDTNRKQDIFVFDREWHLNGTYPYQRVNLSASGEQANGWSYAPDISADGRWVVFISNATDLIEGEPQFCDVPPINLKYDCYDVFLVDRQKDTIQRISQGKDGTRSNGDSYLPRISANGRYVVYWSEANKLVSDDQLTCSTNYGNISCLDVFIYDRQTGLTDRIPIGRDPDLSNRLQTPQISTDGRFVLLTVRENDAAAALIPGFQFAEDIFIYDQRNSTFTPATHTPAGEPANAPALNASLTPDGRFVAFTSAANNLVEGDTNERIDVFVHDFQNGVTDRVSVASDGTEGNQHSGVTRQSLGGLTDKISLSPDGRFVAFVSYADNLAEIPVLCTPPPTLLTCNHLYLHDRENGETKLVASALRDVNLIAFPSVSDDGRIMSYLAEQGECVHACTEIWVVNLETGEEWNISRTDTLATAPPFPWLEQSPLTTSMSTNSLAFSPGGDLLAVGSNDGTIHLWNLADTTSEAYILENHNSPITRLAFSPLVGKLNGQPIGQYILASADTSGKALLWQVSASMGTLRIALEDHPGIIHALAFSSDGKYWAVAHNDGIWLWELQPTFAVLIHQWEIGPVMALAFHPESDLLAAANGDGKTWLISIPDGKTVARLDGKTENLSALAWEPDGQILATGNLNGEVNFWKVAISPGQVSGITLLKRLAHHQPIHELAFSPDGDYLAVGTESNGLWVWDLSQNYPTQITFSERRMSANTVAFSPNEQWIAAGSQRGEVILAARPGPIIADPQTEETVDWRYFVRLPYDEYTEQQILMINDGQTYDPTTPMTIRYSLTTREFSSLTGVYIRVPDVLPPEAVYLGQVNISVRVVSLYYDLPWNEFQNVQIILHVATGYGQNRINYADFPDHRVGLSAKIEAVNLGAPDNPILAEVARGGWTYFSDQAPTVKPDDQWMTVDWSVRWLDNPAWMTLRWQVKDALFEISVSPKEGIEINEEIPLITLEDLLAIAGEMINPDR